MTGRFVRRNVRASAEADVARGGTAPRRSRIYILVAVAVLGGLAFAGYVRYRAPAGADDSVPVYQTAVVTRGTIAKEVAASGRLAPLVTVDVSSQVSGLVTEVCVDFNSAVEKGQVLARIDPASFAQKLRQSEADLAAATTEALRHE